MPESEVASTMNRNSTQLTNGTMLGIHNVYIVLPQIISSCVSAIIFHTMDTQLGESSPLSIAAVWTFGGVSVIVAAIISTRL